MTKTSIVYFLSLFTLGKSTIEMTGGGHSNAAVCVMTEYERGEFLPIAQSLGCDVNAMESCYNNCFSCLKRAEDLECKSYCARVQDGSCADKFVPYCEGLPYEVKPAARNPCDAAFPIGCTYINLELDWLDVLVFGALRFVHLMDCNMRSVPYLIPIWSPNSQ